ncbi:transmembrane protein 177 [Ischnura elegans]|uniref:transmembrane protein 177 n=1 Tax=Ischnura elegans TaxID=197161 RepID=UPI001ED89995|nr:transmembrane protein 177 [Ischnura elegans]
MASKISWFASETGRKFAFVGSFTVGFGFFLGRYLPNTFFLENYQNVMQMYRMGTGVPVPQKVTKRFEQVLEDMKVPEGEKSSFKIFTIVGFDMFHAGSTLAKTGCIIGIPRNYMYDSSFDIEKSEILVNQHLVPWTTPEGKAFEEAVVLSPAAQKYAMACQVSLCQSPFVFLLGLYPMLTTFFAYATASSLNTRFQLHSRRFYIRGTMYSIIGLFAFGLWALANDFTTSRFEMKADLDACAVSPEYARGGEEFYKKILARNIALRQMMGPEGEKVFTAYGNDQVFFRQKHLPITVRKSLVEKKVREAMSKTENGNVESVAS